ncbi:hypothetical protein CUN61_19060 [Pseudomonas arsenicoxydans]|uniref:Uncharacterized protein n=1 Tax=Pseudomonas arsenicoxydans TaxID=702115 RepID=A0A4P6G8J6_9PSED|nr:hypothetical protein CUN61_19060 [Pseudomonas arsenicoxydans]
MVNPEKMGQDSAVREVAQFTAGHQNFAINWNSTYRHHFIHTTRNQMELELIIETMIRKTNAKLQLQVRICSHPQPDFIDGSLRIGRCIGENGCGNWWGQSWRRKLEPEWRVFVNDDPDFIGRVFGTGTVLVDNDFHYILSRTSRLRHVRKMRCIQFNQERVGTTDDRAKWHHMSYSDRRLPHNSSPNITIITVELL